MSVKIMGMVWDLDNSCIEREEKYVLLAYTDHADHNGENMYPSIELICKKTGYKERSAQMITRSLEEKGFLVPDGKGPKGTNKWRYGGGAKFAGVQNQAIEGANDTVRGVQQNAPESLKPSIKSSMPFEWKALHGEDITDDDIKKANTEINAPIVFEKAFGFGTLPWSSNTTWTKFHKFITRLYESDSNFFNEYVAWRAGDGKYKAFSNRKIRENPTAFMDTGYPEYEASKMYRKTDETKPGYNIPNLERDL